ncbi:N-acetyltransferase [Ktedonobacter sp. SOSP1-85]|uniref:GNAT family N-acetyltransferase n=1 Tax=Ktedonobacter sp. SOSP1-85 TaxID=2778367 RepID=UPI001915DFBA|nr:GNAT family N-acetyltransferase [Ktedonobacter sp. SOSP1-85]GHO79320.1 N-acetyltransferase [Ktedonobacter sp. SOSP1-85]
MSKQVIETARLILCPLVQEELTTFRPLWQNELVQQFEGGVFSSEAISKRLTSLLHHWEQHGFGLWSVHKRETKEVLGLCGLEVHEAVELVYRLDPKFWSYGYATEAATACLFYGFQILHLDSIVGITQEANRASQRVLEKVGLQYVCSFRKWNALQRRYELTQAQWLTELRSGLPKTGNL